jgi:hypothetical protein
MIDQRLAQRKCSGRWRQQVSKRKFGAGDASMRFNAVELAPAPCIRAAFLAPMRPEIEESLALHDELGRHGRACPGYPRGSAHRMFVNAARVKALGIVHLTEQRNSDAAIGAASSMPNSSFGMFFRHCFPFANLID